MENSRTTNSVKNIIFSYMNQFVMLVLGFVSRTIFIKTLGMDYLGINGLFADVLNMLSLADLGFGTAMTYSFYKPLAENDKDKIVELINFYRKIYNKIAMAVTLLGLMVIPFLRLIVHGTKISTPLLIIYYLFALSNVVISYLFVYRTSIISASQKGHIISSISIRIQIATVIIQTVVLLLFKNYIIYLSVATISALANNFIASSKATKMFPYIKEKRKNVVINTTNIYNNLKSVFLYKLSSVLLNATDNIIISIVISTVAVGIYSNYLLLQTKISSFIQVIFYSITASVGNIIVTEGEEKRLKVFKSLQSLSFILCGIIVVTYCALANDVINIWLGKDYVFKPLVVYMVTLNMYLGYILLPLWTYRDATGLYQKTKYVMLMTAILNLVLSFVLGKILGVAGVLAASAIARLLTYFWYEPFILFKDYFGRNPVTYYISLGKHFVMTICLAVLALSVSEKWKVCNWFQVILKMIIFSLALIIVYLSVYSRTEGFKLIQNKIKYLFKNKLKRSLT